MSKSQTPLGEWLIEACEVRGLSWAEASRRAGLYQGAISATVRGTQPGLEICKRLAALFGVPPDDVLRMAGHLAQVEEPVLPGELVGLVREMERLPLPLQLTVFKAWRAVLECAQAERQPATCEPAPNEAGTSAGNLG